MTAPQGWICGPRIYEFAGWTFGYGYTGVWPLKKDGELRKRCGKKFFKDVEPFLKLSDKKKRRYRIGGGCQSF
ncbi:MAG: hypothetical protein UY18_C0050G0018 [Microgenomates group bacterium GW2011_GWF2_47_9]|nr:MAG: hypothetical protein UY18_C0050G0018 [Microgenomates group bacterium GW2011_GWF2_47_9]